MSVLHRLDIFKHGHRGPGRGAGGGRGGGGVEAQGGGRGTDGAVPQGASGVEVAEWHNATLSFLQSLSANGSVGPDS